MGDGWADWVKSMDENVCHHGAIFTQTGSKCGSRNFEPTTEEVTKLSKCMKEHNDSELFANGVTLGNQKYTVVRRDDDVLVVKGKNDIKAKTVTVCMTKTAIVFAGNKDESVTGAQVREAAEKLKKNLEDVGF